MSKSAINLAITLGDPSGIGPEVTVKAVSKLPIPLQQRVIIVGAKSLLGCLSSPVVEVPFKDPGEGALAFLAKGVELIKGGVADGLVTAPLSKERVNRFCPGFLGHTEYLAQAFGAKHVDMMFVSQTKRLTIVTRHVPLSKVPSMISKKSVFDSIMLMHATLQGQFHIRKPKIAVLGLNPHAGEHGLLGHEDDRHIAPAIEKAKALGVLAFGPLPADTFFIHDKGFDGTVAMYHDQGLAPMKGLYFKDLVNFTAGLSIIRTSPVHGTAFDIAGRGIADPSSMSAAIHLAFQLLGEKRASS